MRVTLSKAPGCGGHVFTVTAEDGREVDVQADWDYPGLARTFGWNLAAVQAKQRTATFERFELVLPAEAIAACSHSGDCGPDVEAWAAEIARPETATPDALRAELRECGAWDDDQLADDAANWERIVWIAAGYLKDDRCAHGETDGTVDCPECGCTAAEFIAAAWDYLSEHEGETAEDPGYF